LHERGERTVKAGSEACEALWGVRSESKLEEVEVERNFYKIHFEREGGGNACFFLRESREGMVQNV